MILEKILNKLNNHFKNGWFPSVAKSINDDGSECELLNLENYAKTFSDKKTYTLELRRFVYEDDFRDVNDRVEATKGWQIIFRSVEGETIENIEKSFAVEPNSYIKALNYVVTRMDDLEKKYG
ncbi:MAG: hypothetical protein ACTSPI_01440 [Candidatus Heimdallarchaeaceae archaeon]